MPGKRTIVRRFTVEIQLSWGHLRIKRAATVTGKLLRWSCHLCPETSCKDFVTQSHAHTGARTHTHTHTLINLSKGAALQNPADPRLASQCKSLRNQG